MSAAQQCNIDTGDTAWVLVSTVLVLGMMPALALFEAGLLRSKNTLSIATQIIGGLTVLAFMWNVFGFSLVYSTTVGGIIGNLDNVLLINVSYSDCNPRLSKNIPIAAFAAFQMMFACITPLLMTGAYAERLKFKAFMMITVLWEIFVFYPIAHWIWGGGWLGALGVMDFAGGIVIHVSAGIGALVLAIMVGHRHEFEKYHGEFPPSNLPLAVLGAALLWMGWFGFNAGSALSASAVAVSAVASTQIAACVSGIVWLALSWIRDRPSCVALINGVIAGLAGVTPASGYISSESTLVLGLILGVASFYGVVLMKHKLHIDDALDVSSVHGLTGLIGSIFIGFCSETRLNPIAANGVVFGGGRLLWVQLVGVIVVLVYAAVVTYLIGLVTQHFVGLRITIEEEISGLDMVEHAEFAYHKLVLVGHERYGDMEEESEQNNYANLEDVAASPAENSIRPRLIRTQSPGMPKIQHKQINLNQ
eukprot:TRINITY_DN5566_c0_g1_i1.p1 TRINITY_DN5566_c0_g1~~TRINITY_DN5566_c0_g1_i1.p1  ORF type:complete len:477 (-),score=172.07 TRINITY_DN5566_c0_g1_i1:77-1507(-)